MTSSAAMYPDREPARPRIPTKTWSRAGASGEAPSAEIAKLVKEARTGDRRALAELLARHADMVERLVSRLEAPGDVRADLVQESFLEAIASLSALKSPKSFEAWLRQIVFHTVSHHRQRRAVRLKCGPVAMTTPLDLETLASGHLPLDGTVEARRLMRLANGLPAHLRAVVVLHHIEGRGHAEVAKTLKVSLATSKRWLKYAERAMRTPGRRVSKRRVAPSARRA